MMKRFWKTCIGLIWPLILVCAILFFMTAVSHLDHGKAVEEKLQLETALTRAAVACYAIEGAYPPTLEYLVEHYGVQINTDRFTVKYELFASNMMPDITVLDYSS